METKNVSSSNSASTELVSDNKPKNLIITTSNPVNTSSEAEKSVSEEKETDKIPNRTETQLATLDRSKYAVMAYILTNSSGAVIISLESEQDYKQGRWHYVPKDIPAEHQAEFNGKKYSFEVYCSSDKNSQKRLKKMIRRFMPGIEVAFLPVEAGKYIHEVDIDENCTYSITK